MSRAKCPPDFWYPCDFVRSTTALFPTQYLRGAATTSASRFFRNILIAKFKVFLYKSLNMDSDKPRIIDSNKGKPLLVYKNFTYHHHSDSKDGSKKYWRCELRKKCNARTNTNNDPQNLQVCVMATEDTVCDIFRSSLSVIFRC